MALVIVAHSAYEHWEQLPQVPDAVADFKNALDGSGYEAHLPQFSAGGAKGEIEASLDGWLRQLSAKDRLLLYWIGHGAGNGGHYLVTRDSPKGDLTGAVALRADVLGEMIAKSPAEKVVVILDTCYSSLGAQGMASKIHEILNSHPSLPGQERCVAVIPSASALTKAQEGACCRALLKLLVDSDPAGRSWGDQDEWIAVGDLSDALVARLKKEFGPAWQPPNPAVAGIGQRFLPNPRFRGARPALDVETRRGLVDVPEAFSLAARGIDVGEVGWYFVGRRRLLAEIVGWLKQSTPGLAIVTGPPGSGKSAVVGRVATLSDPGFRAEAARVGALPSDDSVPPEGLVDAALHLKGMTVGEAASALAEGLGLQPAGGGPPDSQMLIDAINSASRHVTIIVDALDEAAHPAASAEFLVKFARETDARVLIGSRRSLEGRVATAGEDRHAELRGVFGDEAKILDLEDETDTDNDIEAYVAARLANSRHAGDSAGIVRVAQTVAKKANGTFLYARVVARTLQDAPNLDGPLPDSAVDAFVDDLVVRFEEQRDLVDALLGALAWGEGAGLSRRAWAPVASALSPSGTRYDDADVMWVLEHAGWHVLEAGEAGQTVYRLAHQAFADYYRARIADSAAAQRAIAVALRQP